MQSHADSYSLLNINHKAHTHTYTPWLQKSIDKTQTPGGPTQSLCLCGELAVSPEHQSGAQKPRSLPEYGPGDSLTEDEGGGGEEEDVVGEEQPEVPLPLQAAEVTQQVELSDTYKSRHRNCTGIIDYIIIIMVL